MKTELLWRRETRRVSNRLRFVLLRLSCEVRVTPTISRSPINLEGDNGEYQLNSPYPSEFYNFAKRRVTQPPPRSPTRRILIPGQSRHWCPSRRTVHDCRPWQLWSPPTSRFQRGSPWRLLASHGRRHSHELRLRALATLFRRLSQNRTH